MSSNIETDTFAGLTQLRELRDVHRDLDETIAELVARADVDHLQIKRLKKRKLRLRDMIVRLESRLIPDLNA